MMTNQEIMEEYARAGAEGLFRGFIETLRKLAADPAMKDVPAPDALRYLATAFESSLENILSRG